LQTGAQTKVIVSANVELLVSELYAILQA